MAASDPRTRNAVLLEVGTAAALGVRMVILHRGLASGTAWGDADARPSLGLGLERRRIDEFVVYDPRSAGQQ